MIAPRDTPAGVRAGTSATAVMLRLANASATTRHTRPHLFVSTDGSTIGNAGVRWFLERFSAFPITAAIVLDAPGEANGDRVDVWTAGRTDRQALGLRAHRRRAPSSAPAGGPTARRRSPRQLMRLAVPQTFGDQGATIADGIPAVTLSARGESPLRPGREPTEERMALVANAANNLLGALDGATTVPAADGTLAFAGKFLRPTVARLALLLLALPVLVATLDIVARRRRQGVPLGDGLRAVGVRAIPIGVAVFVAHLLALGGLLPGAAAGAPPLPSEARFGALAGLAIAISAGAGALAWAASRRRARRIGAPAAAESAAALAVISALLIALWILSPFALALAVPAAHAALLAPDANRPWHLPALAALALLPVAAAGRDDRRGAQLQPVLRGLVPHRHGRERLARRHRSARGGALRRGALVDHRPDRRPRDEGRVRRDARPPPAPPPRAAPPACPSAPRQGRPRVTSGAVAARLAFVSVVVPVYNERESVRPLTEELLAVLRTLGRRVEVLFVDDGSTDGTSEILTDLATAEPEVGVVRLRRNFGKAAALMAGFREARGDAVVTIDGDLQDDPSEIPRLLAELEAGADLVSGWKRDRQDPWSKRAASKVFNGVTARMSGIGLHDLNCGFKAYRAEVVRSLALTGDQYRYIPVLAADEGFRVTELPVNHRPRRYGRSKYGLERYLRGFLDLMTILFVGRFRQRPMHLFGGLGVLFIAVGTVICAYLTVLRILGESIGTRPLLLLGVLLIVVGVQLFTIGLVSEMIQRYHLRPQDDEARSRVERVLR